MIPSRKSVSNALIVCVILVSLEVVQGHECSRELSRKVNSFLLEDLFPRMKLSPFDLPANCTINPTKDVFAYQESSKTEVNRGEWQCNFCNKRFINEFYLDRHMEKMHSGNLMNNGVCLADFCEIIGCRTKDKKNDFEGYSSNKKKFGTLELCTVEDIAVHVQQCEQVAETCFPSIDDKQLFNKILCKNLKCVNGILKGGLEAFSHETFFVYWILRLIGCVALFVVVCFHAMVSENNIFTLFGFHGSKHSKKDDYLSKFYASKNSSPFQRMQILYNELFKKIKKEIVFMFKYKGKSS